MPEERSFKALEMRIGAGDVEAGEESTWVMLKTGS